MKISHLSTGFPSRCTSLSPNEHFQAPVKVPLAALGPGIAQPPAAGRCLLSILWCPGVLITVPLSGSLCLSSRPVPRASPWVNPQVPGAGRHQFPRTPVRPRSPWRSPGRKPRAAERSRRRAACFLGRGAQPRADRSGSVCLTPPVSQGPFAGMQTSDRGDFPSYGDSFAKEDAKQRRTALSNPVLTSPGSPGV